MSKAAKYVAKYRDRLKAAGYIKKEVWIPPQFAAQLKLFEKAVRKGKLPDFNTGTERTLKMGINDAKDLMLVLAEFGQESGFEATLVEGNVVEIVAEDMEEFPMFAAVNGDQITVMAPLLEVVSLEETAQDALNRAMLEMNPAFPLSDFAIVGPNYVLFGSLSVNSKPEVIVEEVTTLANNIVEALELIDEVVG